MRTSELQPLTRLSKIKVTHIIHMFWSMRLYTYQSVIQELGMYTKQWNVLTAGRYHIKDCTTNIVTCVDAGEIGDKEKAKEGHGKGIDD